MPSQFFGLNIAYTGLLASNAALNTTANNIANTETVGYSRQTVNQSAAEALRTFTTYGCAGAGVDVLSIERIRDEFYDQKYWSTNTNAGSYNMKQYYMRQVENYFMDDSTIEGFTSVFNKMMDALAEVKKQGGTGDVKSQFIGFADNMTEYFNNMAGNMEQIQKDVNSEIKLKIDEINSIASEIATLNKQINVIEMNSSGYKANELRDQRTLLLDSLSAIVNIETTELPITDLNDPTRETGGTRFIVKIAGGQTLVDANDYRTMECIARTQDEKVNQSDIDGLYDVYWVSDQRTGAIGDEFNLYNARLGGELQGLVEMRDGNNGEYFNGTVTAIGTDPDGRVDESGKVLKTVTVEVKEEYLLDLNKTTLSNNGGKINLANQIFYYKDWSYSYDETTGKTTYTFTIDETMSGENLNNTKLNKEASIGAGVKYQGIPYYQQQMNEWVRVFANSFNTILSEGYDAQGNSGTILFTGDMETDNGQLQFMTAYNQKNADGTRKSETVKSKDDSYYRLTAKNFNVLTAMTENADLLATRSDATAGSDEYGNVTRLINMTTDKSVVNFRGAATGEFLTCILSDVALNANSANTFYTNYSNVGKAIDNQRTSISGVDKDEEAVNLVKYQNAYTLASKMIQTLTEVYDRLILQTGV
ncbi:MAG: flagellar hook-associated protein FlgK [Lachnospiraceae bacterium]|nr:flagellar hook-associated protein FlgK [Lachnospiraceae bacterium]